MITPVAFVLVAAAGSIARWQLSRLNTPAWPAGTLFVNVTGAFLLGLLAAATTTTIVIVGVGLLGSYSTFSTVARELVALPRAGGWARTILYLGLTLLLGVGAALLGIELAE